MHLNVDILIYYHSDCKEFIEEAFNHVLRAVFVKD